MIYATKLFNKEFVEEHYDELVKFLNDPVNKEKLKNGFLYGKFENDLTDLNEGQDSLLNVCFIVNSLKLIEDGLVFSIKPTNTEKGKKLEHMIAKEDTKVNFGCDLIKLSYGIDLIFYCKEY